MQGERRMSRERLDTPEMRAAIAKAKARAESPAKQGGGSTAEDLLRQAREHRRVDSRT
jgi:hypothetical protein